MPITALPALDRTSVNFKANVDTFFGSQLPTFSTEAEAARVEINNNTASASASAATATTKAGEALTSANNAATSKTGADTARDAAVVARTAAEAALDSFDDRYLGAKAVAPTLDNDGAALLTGALYWDTALPGMRSWNGAAWVTLPAATAAAISNTPAGGISATTVQAAIDELDTEKAKVGANSDITSLAGLTTPLSLSQGGTAGATAAAARANLAALNLEFMHVRDEKPAGTSGGASVAGNQVRTLNTVVSNTITGASLAANEVTLPAGTYRIFASAPNYSGSRHRARLVNVTDAAVALLGTGEFNSGPDQVAARSTINGRIVIAATKAFNITHAIALAQSPQGLGVEQSDTFTEVYTTLMIWKE